MTHDQITLKDLALKIDHTLLHPIFHQSELQKLCEEATFHGFKTVCVPPTWVKTAVSFLADQAPLVITVVGFPLGYAEGRAKALETQIAIESGAQEIDMVINLSFVKNERWDDLAEDVIAVKRACGNLPLKAILETAYLNDAEKIKASQICEAAGANFIKTSTGFASGVSISGATLADIELLRKNLKTSTKIKASGGIRDFPTAIAFLNAGADRLGTSSGVQILKGIK